LEGALAGYGIAMPVGPITILIVEMSLRRGFSHGFMAGAGAAVVDFLFAGLAVLAGEALAPLLAPFTVGLRVTSALVLIGWGLFGFWRTRRLSRVEESKSEINQRHLHVFVQFLGLTAINPLTLVFFSALILGRGMGDVFTLVEKGSFVLGVGLASFSWQTMLAVFGATLHRNLSPRLQVLISLLGNMVVIVLGLRVLLSVGR
jgi:threonine/homoserine/homoserine lactone efflux protein